MPTSFITGLLQGIGSGIEQNRQQKQQDELLNLQKKQAALNEEVTQRKLQMDAMKMGDLMQQQQSRQSLRDIMTTPETAAEASPASTPEDIAASGLGSGGYERARRSSLRSALVGLPEKEAEGMAKTLQIGAYDPQAQAQQMQQQIEQQRQMLQGITGGQPGGTNYNTTYRVTPGKPLSMTIAPQRQGVSPNAKLFDQWRTENPNASFEEQMNTYNVMVGGQATARSTGSQQGALGVHSSPPYIANQRDLATARAGGTVAGGAQARINAPIAAKDIMAYVNPNGQTPNNDPSIKSLADMTPQALSQRGYMQFPDANTRQAYRSGLQGLTQLDRMDKLVDKLYKGVDKGENLANALKLRGKQVLGDNDARLLERMVLETIPNMALQTGMTAGRVGETILEHVEKPQFPNMTDTYQSAKGSIANMKQRLGNNINTLRGVGIPAHLVSEAQQAAGFEGNIGGGQTPPATPPAAAPQGAGAPPGTLKKLGGKTYLKTPTGWIEQ